MRLKFQKKHISIGISAFIILSWLGICCFNQFYPELSKSWGIYMFGYSLFLLLISIGLWMWVSWEGLTAGIHKMHLRLLDTMKSWWVKLLKMAFLIMMLGIAVLMYYWAYLNISKNHYLPVLLFFLGIITIPLVEKLLKLKENSFWAKKILMAIRIFTSVLVALIFPAVLFFSYLVIASMFFFIPLVFIILMMYNYGWELNIEAASFVCFVIFSISIVHLSTYTKKFIFSILPLIDVTNGYTKRFREFTDYVLQKELLNFIVYALYAIFLIILGVKELALGSPVFSIKTDRALMLSFLVYIAINNMIGKSREVKITIDEVFNKFIHIIKE